MLASVFRAARSRSLAPVCVRALCTKRPAATGSDSKEVTTEPTYKNKDGVATYNYGESLNLPEVTKEQAENAYLEATDVRRAMTPPVAVAVEARDDMLKDRFNYVAKNLNPKTRCLAFTSTPCFPLALIPIVDCHPTPNPARSTHPHPSQLPHLHPNPGPSTRAPKEPWSLKCLATPEAHT